MNPPLFVMTYEPSEGFGPLAAEHGPAHVARLHEFHDRGVLVHAGPLSDPFDGTAIGVFTSREAAEEFIAGDPFVLGGVVARWTVRGWGDLFAPAGRPG
ncbi:YciI family protein [Pseudonocardia benzenivorans]|uniref:YCII-related protein n=2 Tax=Pseudonocardia TaxID=1847 RepID=F4CL98_PSEUX|nr:YciI family protein [Pseudonocardia dioxanivorans]AEA25940.1 YCII-related protein [Pseudonocardia dioxanivorans CB1190]GJF04085.1 hypothetical protein PSD17_30430 [Pseudonocardia sp. D17]